MVVNGIENELIIITKQTFDAFLRSDFPADLIALYNFYYYTAKWQETNQPKCTTGYTAEGLKWSEAKVRRAKKELMRLGLVEDVQQKVNGKVTGCFIKLNYILKQENVNHPYDFSQCGNNEENNQIHPNDFSQGGIVHRVEKLQTNALSSDNINALNADNINALSSDTLASEIDTKAKSSLKELEKDFEEVWKAYPKKQGKEAAKKAYIKARKAGTSNCEIVAGLTRYKLFIQANRTEDRYIKHGSTWFNQKCWEDDYSINEKPAANNTVPSEDDYDFERGSFWK
jgi:hypothetical protein